MASAPVNLVWTAADESCYNSALLSTLPSPFPFRSEPGAFLPGGGAAMSPGRSLALLLTVLATTGLPGCLLVEPWGDFWRQVKRNAKPSADDQRDFTRESQEEWRVVGDEGRRHQTVEVDPDQWYRKYILSEKAREIEENLGFE